MVDVRKFIILLLLLPQIAFAAVPACGPDEVSGLIFRDYNGDGLMDVAEAGSLATVGLNVRAYDSSGAEVAVAPVSFDGSYSFPSLSGISSGIRLELTDLPSFLQFGSYGSNSKSSVRFLSSSGCNYDFAVHNPADHCAQEVDVTVPCMESGSGVGNVHKANVFFLRRLEELAKLEYHRCLTFPGHLTATSMEPRKIQPRMQ